MVFMCIKHVDNKRLATFQSRFPATRKVRSHQLNDKQNLSSPPPPQKKNKQTKQNKGTCTSFRSITITSSDQILSGDSDWIYAAK